MKIYAVIGEQLSDGETGIVAGLLPSGALAPLICLKESNVKRLLALAKLAVGHTNYRLVRFTEEEVVCRLQDGNLIYEKGESK